MFDAENNYVAIHWASVVISYTQQDVGSIQSSSITAELQIAVWIVFWVGGVMELYETQTSLCISRGG